MGTSLGAYELNQRVLCICWWIDELIIMLTKLLSYILQALYNEQVAIIDTWINFWTKHT